MFKQFWVLLAFALRSCLSWGILALITCIPCFATTPQVTVSATSQTLLGTNDTISLTATLIDPNSTGMLRVSGAGVITTLKTTTVTAGTTATLGPIWGNDVIIDGLGNLNNTYYEVQVFKVNNSIIASTPVLQNFYAFTGSGTIDLATATPVAPSFLSGTNGSVSVPGTLSVTGGATFSGGLSATKLENIRFSDSAFFASSQAAINDCGSNPCLVINPSQLGYSTSPTDTAANKLYLDLNNSYFTNNATDSAGLTFYGFMGNGNTLDSTKAPYDFLRIETHANAANLNTNALHVVSQKIDATAEPSLGANIGIYGQYINLNIKKVGASATNPQHAVAEEIVNDSAQNDPSVLYGHDLHLIRHNGVSTADGQLVGYEVGFHKDGPAWTLTSYSIATCTRASNVTTYTFTGAPVAAAFATAQPQTVRITGVAGGTTSFNGEWQIVPGSSTTSQFQVNQTGANESCTPATGVAIASTQQQELAFHAWGGNYTNVVTSPTSMDTAFIADDGFGNLNWNNTFVVRKNSKTRFRVDGNGHLYLADTTGYALTSAGALWPGLFQITRDSSGLPGQMQCIYDFTSASTGAAGAEGWCIGFVQGATTPYLCIGPAQTNDANFTRDNCLIWADPTAKQPVLQNPLWGDGATGNKGGVDTNGKGTFAGGLVPLAAAGADVGSTALPFLHLWLGTAATNNFEFIPAATSAARTVSIADPGANSQLRTEISGTATVDLASVASGACSADSSDVTVTGAAVGDDISVTAGTALQAGSWLIGRVTASNTARFQFCNLSGGAIDRASDTYTIRVKR